MEDIEFKSVIPLSFSHHRWLEKAMVEMMFHSEP